MTQSLPLPILLILCACSLRAQSAEEIIARSENLIKGNSCRGSFTMTVTTPEYTRTMEMDSWWIGNDKALIVIRAPKKEAGNKTLKIRNEMWSYLKNTETTIKIPPSMMLQSWNGSDFTNDDLVRESNLATDYTQRIMGVERLAGEDCWKIELTPKPEAPVVWGRLYYWIRKKDYVPAAIEYYDERGRKARTMLFSDVRSMGGRTIPSKWTMINDAKAGHRTSFEITRIAFDERIPERIFSFQELERGN